MAWKFSECFKFADTIPVHFVISLFPDYVGMGWAVLSAAVTRLTPFGPVPAPVSILPRRRCCRNRSQFGRKINTICPVCQPDPDWLEILVGASE
jgi:hypothetical protein